MSTDEHSLPAAHVLYVVELVKRWNLSANVLLADSGLDLAALAQPRRRLPIATVVQILERARSLTGQEALGLYLGLKMQVSAHGSLGAAAMSASTMQEALEITIRFLPIVTTALALRLRVEGPEASLIVEERADFGGARDIVLMAVLMGIWRAGEILTGRELLGFVDLAVPSLGSNPGITFLGPRVRFGQPATRLVFETSMLALRYRTVDPVAAHFAREQCERTLRSLGLEERMTTRVTGLLSNGSGKGVFPSLEKVAAALAVSPRTLKRQLASEGGSFSGLIEKERHERAIILLGMPGLSLKDVADRLGYSNIANFSRAFLRWSGMTPGEHQARRPAESSSSTPGPNAK
jgi:AraC-like DNA-binding protein